MAQDFLIDISDFSQGLQLLAASQDAPIGSARQMSNMTITDRFGIGPRPGTSILGTYDAGTTGCDGFYNFLKSGQEGEIPVKASNGQLKYFHPTLLDWALLKSNYTVGAEFGFKENLVNTENEDYLYWGNGVENYSRWPGSTTTLNGAFVSGTTLTVASTLKAPVFESGTSTATSATTVTDSTKTWAASYWISYYVLITSGAQSGKISKITANTSNQLTFDAITDPVAGATYQIVMPKFPPTGKLTVGTTTVTYSAVPTSTTFTITDPAVGIADKSAVTLQPTEYPAAPRGNRLETYQNRMIVGNVQSGQNRDASGNLQGAQSTATIYVSKIKNAADFGFSAPRVAGEGDFLTAPYGGGNITDVSNFEDSFVVFKKYYIELDSYPTNVATDIVKTTPLKQQFGSLNHVVKGRDDIYFVTADNQITSLGRVKLTDTIPQTVNVGLIVKRLIDTFDFSSVVGHELAQRILFACKQKVGDAKNNQIIVYNKQTKSFEGIWYLNASQFDLYGGKLYAADSTSPNVYQLFTADHNDVRSASVKFGITSSWKSNWIHMVPRRSRFRVKPSQFQTMGINCMGFEGIIADGTVVTFSLMKDFTETPVMNFDFGILPDDEVFMQGAELGAFLGQNPLGLAPLGTISDPAPDGTRHFKFVVYFPDIYSNYLSIGVDNSGKNQNWEINRFGIGTSEETIYDAATIKDISTN
jgi:hypothetical protein